MEKWCLFFDIVVYICFFYYYLFVFVGFIIRYVYLCFCWLFDKCKLDVKWSKIFIFLNSFFVWIYRIVKVFIIFWIFFWCYNDSCKCYGLMVGLLLI